MGRREERNRRKQAEADDGARLSEPADILVSSLSQTSRPFEEVDLYWSGPFPSPEEAFDDLKAGVIEDACDAVLGVGLCGIRTITDLGVRGMYVAYGTGVRWVPEEVVEEQ